ncbi:hypothetical protein FQN50_005566 [Emmonsiellopsis sp. PD_5]|nr:hypothetical protein FQN50_005566 [Emmonsiellopsis sp. PD_5]
MLLINYMVWKRCLHFGVEDSIEALNSMDFKFISRDEQQHLQNECPSRDGQMCKVSKAHYKDAHLPPTSFAPGNRPHLPILPG